MRTRFDDDITKIRIKSQIKNEQCIFSIIEKWNNANPDLRNAGNLFSLKRLLTYDLETKMKDCTKNNCFSCKTDVNKDYLKYIKV